jgi:hypothetical protein
LPHRIDRVARIFKEFQVHKNNDLHVNPQF